MTAACRYLPLMEEDFSTPPQQQHPMFITRYGQTEIELHCFRIGKSKYQLWRNYTNNGAGQYGGGWYPMSTTTCFIFMFVTTPVWIIVLKRECKKEGKAIPGLPPEFIRVMMTDWHVTGEEQQELQPVQYRCDAGSHDHRRSNKRVWIVGLKF